METRLFKKFDKRKEKRLAKHAGKSDKNTKKIAAQDLAMSRRQQNSLEAKKR